MGAMVEEILKKGGHRVPLGKALAKQRKLVELGLARVQTNLAAGVQHLERQDAAESGENSQTTGKLEAACPWRMLAPPSEEPKQTRWIQQRLQAEEDRLAAAFEAAQDAHVRVSDYISKEKQRAADAARSQWPCAALTESLSALVERARCLEAETTKAEDMLAEGEAEMQQICMRQADAEQAWEREEAMLMEELSAMQAEAPALAAVDQLRAEAEAEQQQWQEQLAAIVGGVRSLQASEGSVSEWSTFEIPASSRAPSAASSTAPSKNMSGRELAAAPSRAISRLGSKASSVDELDSMPPRHTRSLRKAATWHASTELAAAVHAVRVGAIMEMAAKTELSPVSDQQKRQGCLRRVGSNSSLPTSPDLSRHASKETPRVVSFARKVSKLSPRTDGVDEARNQPQTETAAAAAKATTAAPTRLPTLQLTYAAPTPVLPMPVPTLAVTKETELRHIYDRLHGAQHEEVTKRDLILMCREDQKVADFFQLPRQIHQEDGSRDAVERCFQGIDTDGNKKISWAEFKSWHARSGPTQDVTEDVAEEDAEIAAAAESAQVEEENVPRNRLQQLQEMWARERAAILVKH